MIYKVKGANAIFTIDFKVDGEFVIPELDSVYLTVRDSSLISYPSYNNQPLPGITTSSYQLSVDSIVQTTSEETTLRFVQLKFTSNGVVHSQNFSYTVTDFLPITVSAEDVRNIFGAEYREIPDDSFDIPFQYFRLNRKYGALFKSAYLDAVGSQHANRVLAYACALSLIISAPTRILKRERTSDSSEFERQRVDFTALEAKITSMMSQEVVLTLEAMGSTESVSASQEHSLFVLTSPVDVITNT